MKGIPVPFTMDELIRLLDELSGDDVTLDGPVDRLADRDFADLGVDSLALFNALHRIRRTYGVEVPPDVVVELGTPRNLFDAVAQQVSVAVPSQNHA